MTEPTPPTDDPFSELRTNQRKAIESLAAGDSVALAAGQAGVTERTIYNWKKDPLFMQALQQRERAVLDIVKTSINAGMLDAVKVLREIATDPNAPASSRVSAASTLLSGGLKVQERHELIERLESIEQALNIAA